MSFQDDGFVIHRRLIRPDVIECWRQIYQHLAVDRPIEFNPVAVSSPKLAPLLRIIATHENIVNAVRQIFGHDLATYHERFVVKDKHSRGAVFWHQDTGYHFGWPEKLSAFVALTPSTQQNGCLKIARGSHKYGFMADAGHLDINVFRGLEVCEYEMEPGDALLMHSACWHSSGECIDGTDRILTDIIYQPSSDPSGLHLVSGVWRTEHRIPAKMRAQPFLDSRSQRVKRLLAENAELRKHV